MMKKLIMMVLTLSMGYVCNGQVKMPDLSPRTTVKQKVGLTNFELEYSRPSVRDRDIFGDLLPFGELWRTGANKNSMLTFDTDIQLTDEYGDVALEAGTYAIFTRVDKNVWKIYFYEDTENWGTPEEWDEEKVAAEMTIPSNNKAPKQETFAITFENIGTSDFDLVFAWDTRRVSIPVSTPAKELALKSIEATMGGPSDRDYYAAASYYLTEGIELEKALEYIKKAVELRGEEAFWYTRKQALIEYELGDKKAAIKSAKKSLAAAEKANYASYIKSNKESIEAWSK